MSFFLPKQPAFAKYFKEMSQMAKEIADLLGDFTSNLDNFEHYSRKAREIEHQADNKTHEIIIALNTTFITPFDREDIYELVHEMDDVIDLIDNAIHFVNIYGLTEKKYQIDEFGRLIKEAAHSLDELIEEGFLKQKYTEKAKGLIVQIHQIEDQADEIFYADLKALFKEEKDPVLIIKWKEILENLEAITDKIQQVCNTLEGIIVKSS